MELTSTAWGNEQSPPSTGQRILERRKPIAVKPAITKDSSASAHWLSEGTGVGVAVGVFCLTSVFVMTRVKLPPNGTGPVAAGSVAAPHP